MSAPRKRPHNRTPARPAIKVLGTFESVTKSTHQDDFGHTLGHRWEVVQVRRILFRERRGVYHVVHSPVGPR